eukprot:752524-Hanusia_phi.AAC.5
MQTWGTEDFAVDYPSVQGPFVHESRGMLKCCEIGGSLWRKRGWGGRGAKRRHEGCGGAGGDGDAGVDDADNAQG